MKEFFDKKNLFLEKMAFVIGGHFSFCSVSEFFEKSDFLPND